MFLRKLMPSDGNFFALFNEHGNRIVEGARAFMAMVTHYDDPVLREKHAAEVDAAEREARLQPTLDKLVAEAEELDISKPRLLALLRERLS
jgi:hypothetical protein